MKEVAAKLKLFFSGFSLPAYIRSDIPDEVELPYIAYDLTVPRWDVQSNISCQVYYPKNQLGDLLTKADEIRAAIGPGLQIILSSGYVMLYLADQSERMSDDYSESVYIPLNINSYHLPGG